MAKSKTKTRMSDTVARPVGRPLATPPGRAPGGPRNEPRGAPGATASRKTDLGPGSHVEGYQIIRTLGEGSMGMTYLARSLDDGAECVLKTIKFSGHSNAAIFFIREVQMGLKLRHPNIVPVIDFGESGGLLFLAMEYAAGGSLLDAIETRGPLGNAEALGHLIQLAGALEHASQKKFVHRDIKPANILLTAEGVPKLADFGLAKLLAQTRHAELTQTGEMRGTPIYVAPEIVISAARANTQSDIYSLGATYYHALSGRPPFEGDAIGKVLISVVIEEPPRLEALNSRVRPELADVIRRMMHKQAEHRYATPSALVTDLEKLRSSVTM